jgi:hypothetical protein
MTRLVGGLLLALSMAACSGGGSGPDTSHERSDQPGTYRLDDELHLNQVQALGTHNSYHPGPLDTPLPAAHGGAGVARIVDYRHPPLARQLDVGVRNVALDVWADPEGGRFVRRPLLGPTGGATTAPEPEWSEPGLKVFHIAQIDPRSHCILFRECLQQLKAWSDRHPRHLPIMVVVEIKDVDFFGTATDPPLQPWQAADYDHLDAEIRSVLPERRLITPDDVQGGAPTLEAAVLARGWPTLGESRGKFLFVNCNCLTQDRQRLDYLRPDGSLRGRVLFPASQPGNPDAAVVLHDKDADGVRDLVAAGYLVRTRSDANTIEARAGDTRRRDAAFASGAQFVSTDYGVPDPVVNPTFVVEVPGGTPARCNPVNAPAGCRSEDVEDPEHLAR